MGLGSRSLPLRPARVHGGGEAGELDDVLRAVSVVCGDFVVIEYRAYHVGVYGGRPQRGGSCPPLCAGRCVSGLPAPPPPPTAGFARPPRPVFGRTLGCPCEACKRGRA